MTSRRGEGVNKLSHKKDIPTGVSRQDLATLRLDTEKYFWDRAATGSDNFRKAWETCFAKKIHGHRRNEEIEFRRNYGFAKKGDRRRPVPAIDLGWNQVNSFCVWYLGVVDFAAACFVALLAQAVSVSQGLGPDQLHWIRAETDSFIAEKLMPQTVEGWLAMCISEPVEAPRLPGFDDLRSRTIGRLNARLAGWVWHERDHRVRSAVARFGQDKLAIIHQIPRFPLRLEDVGNRKSFSQEQVCRMLDLGTTRAVRNLFKSGTLTRSGNGRVVNDEKLQVRYKLTHYPADK